MPSISNDGTARAEAKFIWIMPKYRANESRDQTSLVSALNPLRFPRFPGDRNVRRLTFVFLLLARHSQASFPLLLLRASVGRFLCHMVPAMQDDAPHLRAGEGIAG